MTHFTLLDLLPDPIYYETKSFWIWVTAAMAATAVLIYLFLRKRKKSQQIARPGSTIETLTDYSSQ